jgi:lysophospholipase L1-like esterase
MSIHTRLMPRPSGTPLAVKTSQVYEKDETRMMDHMRKSLTSIALLVLALSTGSLYAEDLYPPKDLVISTHSKWAAGHYPRRIAEFRTHPLATNDIVFIGDSITEYGGDWAKRLNIKTVKNRGISGDVTAGILARMNELYHYRPKALFVLIGINDLLATQQSPKYIAENTIKISDLMHKNSPGTMVYVQTMLPISQKRGNLQEIRTANRILREHKNPSYKLIDLYAHFADEAGYMKKEYSGDGVHSTPAGYKLWASLIQKRAEAAVGTPAQ